jgi:hypothetical protein
MRLVHQLERFEKLFGKQLPVATLKSGVKMSIQYMDFHFNEGFILFRDKNGDANTFELALYSKDEDYEFFDQFPDYSFRKYDHPPNISGVTGRDELLWCNEMRRYVHYFSGVPIEKLEEFIEKNGGIRSWSLEKDGVKLKMKAKFRNSKGRYEK